MDSNDLILLQKLKGESYDAIEHIFKTYHKKLVSFARRIVKNNHHADDIVMDVFIKFWNQRESIIINKSIEAYLITSVKNQCLNYLRSHKNMLKHYSETDLKLYEFELKYYENDQVIEKMNAAKLEEKINEVILKLPPKQQEVFRLSRSEDLKTDEIAVKLNISKRTVETHIYNALKYLKEEIKKFDSGL